MRRPKSNISFRKEIVLFIILVLILLNFLNFAIYFCYLVIPLFIIIFRKNKNILDKNVFLILCFSIIYPLFLLLNRVPVSGSTLIGYFIFPPTFYFLGKYIVYKYPNNITIYFMFFFICFFFSILPFLANVRSVMEIGFMKDRNLSLLWSKDGETLAATGIGGYFALNMAFLPILFINKVTRTQKYLAALSLILLSMGMFSTLNMSNRAGLLISALSVILFIFMPKNQLKSIFIIIIFTSLVIWIYSINAFNFRSWFEFSYYHERISNSGFNENGSRLVIWRNNLADLFKYPLGNFRLGEGNDYAHNLWLDVGLRTGFIPLIPLIIFSFSAAILIVKISFNRKYDLFLRLLVIGFGISFYLTFLIEPILEGFFILFLLYCLYFGMVYGIKKYRFRINN
jgi:hypothetical protein